VFSGHLQLHHLHLTSALLLLWVALAPVELATADTLAHPGSAGGSSGSPLHAGATPALGGALPILSLDGARFRFDLRLRDPPLDASRLRDLPASRLTGVRRLHFGLDQLPIEGGKLQLHWLRFSGDDSRHGAERFALEMKGKRLSLSALHQESDARLGSDRTVAAEDRALLGNSWGTQKQSVALGYAAGSAGSLTASLNRLRAPEGGLHRQKLAWDGRNGTRFAFDAGHIDDRFQRFGELPEAERKDATQRKGQRWRDVSAALRLTPWLATEGLWTQSQTLAGDRERRRLRQQWLLTPTRRSTLTWARDAATLRDGGQSRHSLQETLRIEQKLPSTTLSWLRDTTTTRAGDQASRRVAESLKLEQKLAPVAIVAGLDTTRGAAPGDSRRLTLRLTTPSGRSLGGLLDLSSLGVRSGRDEQTGRLELTTKLPLLAALKLNGLLRSGDRHRDDRLTGEASGLLPGRLQWRGALAQTRSDGAAGRRDTTLMITPAPPKEKERPGPALSLSFARSETLAALQPEKASPLPPVTEAILLMREQTLGRHTLGLGVINVASGGDRERGLAYNLRLVPAQAVRLDLSRRLAEAGKATSPLLQRESLSFQPPSGWNVTLARERVTVPTATGLASSDSRWLLELGRKTPRLQWSVGAGHQMRPDGRRADLATRLRLEGPIVRGGSLRLDYESFPAVPGPDRLRERLTWTYRQHLDARLSVDLQGAVVRRHEAKEGEITWHADVKAAF
jgi:hypothetical protein